MGGIALCEMMVGMKGGVLLFLRYHWVFFFFVGLFTSKLHQNGKKPLESVGLYYTAFYVSICALKMILD